MESLYALEYFIDANKRIYFIYLISSLIIAWIYLWMNRSSIKVNCSKKLWLHPSARLDYIYFLLSSLIKAALIMPLLISSKEVALFVIEVLSSEYGYVRFNLSYETVMILFTVTLFTVSDLTRYWLHRLLHTIPFLWEFHKVHHSAKVLNPLTFYRVHPVENILFGLRYVLSIGLVTGFFVYAFGPKVGLLEIIGVNVFVFVFSFLGSNLRHSHIALAYPKLLEVVCISPKMHQIHHSSKHFDKNFGGYLAIWDYIFGSHLFSKEVKTMKFGLKKEQMKDYDGVMKLLLTPFINLFQVRRKV